MFVWSYAALDLVRECSILTLCAIPQVIGYSTLVRDLRLSGMRTLEDLIIEGMYFGLFSGKLDQKKQEFQVSHILLLVLLLLLCSSSLHPSLSPTHPPTAFPRFLDAHSPSSRADHTGSALTSCRCAILSQVQETAGRDCKPGQLEDMIVTLQVCPSVSQSRAA